VSIIGPTGGANYVLGQRVTARYICTDSTLGITSCFGSVPNGSSVKTSSVGRYSFTVTAVNNAGRSSTSSVGYAVGYKICEASPPTQNSSTVTFKIYACNVAGGDVMSRSTTMTAVRVDGKEAPLPARPRIAKKFALVLAGKRLIGVYQLDVKGLSAGVHTIRVTVANDPLMHSITFTIRRPAPPRSARR
jgi:hypothetical protein